MESLAAVLRRIPIFADLPRGSFAKIIADLREERHPSGEVICYEGDPARDFFIVKSGTVEVLVNRGGGQRELVAVSGANEWFGERALFTDRPRSATVVARTDVELWRLTKEKFDDLIEENPRLILHFTEVLSDRLHRGNQELSHVQAAFTRHMESFFQNQPAERQTFLTHSAVLTTLDAAMVDELIGRSDGAARLAELEAGNTLVARHDGAVSYLEAVRDFLLGRLRLQIGSDGMNRLRQRAAELYERAGRWEDAIDQYLDGGAFDVAARCIATHADELLAAKRFDLLSSWLVRVPTPVVAAAAPGLPERIEAARTPAERADAVVRARSWTQRLASARSLTWVGAIVGIVAGLGIWFAPPLTGLNVNAMRMLGMLTWAAVFWAFDVLPDYAVGLAMMVGWILFSVVPADVAVSGFTTSPFFLIIGVLGIAASLQSSGLLFRLALDILRRFPPSHSGQILGLALSGTLITPAIPDVTSGAAIAGPIVLAVSDSLGYARLSNGSAALAMAAVLGFGQMSPFFLTGAAENLLAWGLLPDAAHAQITWGGWALAALPLALVTFAGGFTATMLLLPTEFQPKISAGSIETQIEALGPLSRAEIINGVVLLGAVIGWISVPYHQIDGAWIALSGLAILLAFNLLDRATFRAGIYWDFLFYLGAVLSLTAVVHHLGVDDWVIRQLAPMLQPMAAHPERFLLGLGLAVFAARFILPSFPLVSVLVITVVPIAVEAGIRPQALLLVICTTVAVWFLPYQSTYYLALYFGTKEKAFSHGQVRLLAWSYGLTYLLAIVVAIPYWRWLGLIP